MLEELQVRCVVLRGSNLVVLEKLPGSGKPSAVATTHAQLLWEGLALCVRSCL